MLNRTNLTLSARTLSNRLNLGTRSLAPTAGANHGDQTLRTRQTHHDVMREGMDWYDVFSFPTMRYGIPTIPGSLFLQQQCQPSCRIEQLGRSAAAVRVESKPRPAGLVDRPERLAAVGVPRFPAVAVAPPERRPAKRELGFEKRFAGELSGKPGLKRSAGRAAIRAAAASAAIAGK
jgi:hypothetical protein